MLIFLIFYIVCEHIIHFYYISYLPKKLQCFLSAYSAFKAFHNLISTDLPDVMVYYPTDSIPCPPFVLLYIKQNTYSCSYSLFIFMNPRSFVCTLLCSQNPSLSYLIDKDLHILLEQPNLFPTSPSRNNHFLSIHLSIYPSTLIY